jgi:hypothetical protein
MNSLIEQLNENQESRIEKFRSQHHQWLMRFEPHYTHFVTLTFNPNKIYSLMNELTTNGVNERYSLIDLQKKSFRCFLNRLRKNLYGCSWRKHEQRILCVPILEGLHKNGKVHYHCLFGIELDRHSNFKKAVETAWSKAPLSGHQIDVQNYNNIGAISYITKQTKYLNRESIDWENVIVASHLDSLIAE